MQDTKALLMHGLTFINKQLGIDSTLEWNDEDKENLKDVIATIRGKYEDTIYGAELENWLELLPERFNLQPKQEWSEEDKKALNDIIYLIEEINRQPLKRLQDWDGYIRFLKSLRLHWKPSEEQMGALNEAINTLAASKHPHENDYLFNVLNGLRENLKKL